MNAFEAQKASIQAAYEIVMKEIDSAVGNGLKSIRITTCKYYPCEVAEMLAEKGYDVKLNFMTEKELDNLIVSWEKAEPQRKGVITKEIAYTGPTTVPEKKSGFLGRLSSIFSDDDGDDGDW